jgi:hypothetical protein
MIKPTEMTTLSQVIEKLRLKRQDNEFILKPQGFTIGNGKFYQPHDLKIIKTYRFEGESDPSDSSILYVMEANDGSIGYSAIMTMWIIMVSSLRFLLRKEKINFSLRNSF